MTKQELSQAIDEAYQKYADAYYGLNVTHQELDALWQAYITLTEQVAR